MNKKLIKDLEKIGYTIVYFNLYSDYYIFNSKFDNWTDCTKNVIYIIITKGYYRFYLERSHKTKIYKKTLILDLNDIAFKKKRTLEENVFINDYLKMLSIGQKHDILPGEDLIL